MNKKKIIALIPARSGSKRIPDKNIKALKGHPLIAYSIRAAIDSAIFDDVICVTDSEKYAAIARYYGAEVPSLRPKMTSGDKSPDIDWVQWILKFLESHNRSYKLFSILRPTSPFRLPSTIQAAFDLFNKEQPQADSLRAVQECKQHPGKMWVNRNNRLLPILPFMNESTPWHSSQYAALPEIYIQNASLEIACSHLALNKNSIAGESIIPFFSSGLQGFDINNEEDMLIAHSYISSGEAILPTINLPPYLTN